MSFLGPSHRRALELFFDRGLGIVVELTLKIDRDGELSGFDFHHKDVK
jgi:hypothetical protein